MQSKYKKRLLNNSTCPPDEAVIKIRKTTRMIEKLQARGDTPIKPPVPDIKPAAITANQIAYQALREQGLSKCNAANAIGLSNSYPAYLERTGKLRFNLASLKVVKPAFKIVTRILAGQPPTPFHELPASAELTYRCAERVLDQYNPIITKSQTMSVSFPSPVDLSGYRYTPAAQQEPEAGARGLEHEPAIPIPPHEGGEGAGREKNEGVIDPLSEVRQIFEGRKGGNGLNG